MPQVIPLWEKESEAHDATLRADMREVADLLLECGADINARDRVGRTALFSAVADRKMNRKCFEWCLENGADPGAMDVDGMVVFDKGDFTNMVLGLSLTKHVQGWSKRWAPGCVKMR